MLLTSTTDSIDVVLGATATMNQLHLISSYNNSTSTSVTPVKTVTVTNNITPVNLVPAPSSGNSRQLRYASIFNADTVPSTVTVRNNFNGTTRNVISTVLQVNDYMQYTHRTGWKVFNMDGQLRNSDYFNTLTDARAQGRASGPYNTIIINVVISVAVTGTVSWVELAIYKGTPSLASGTTMTRLGFIDIAQTSTQSGQNRFFVIPVSGVTPGDDLWCVYGVSTTGVGPQLRSMNIADVVGAGFIQTAGSNRPSTSLTLTGTVSSSFTFPQTFWNGL